MPVQKTTGQCERLSRGRSFALSVIVYALLSVRLEPVGSYNGGLLYFAENLFGSFAWMTVSRELLIPLCYMLFRNVHRGEIGWTVRVPAALFALFLVVGETFDKTGNWDWIVTIRNAQALKTAMLLLGWYLLFSPLIALLYRAADHFEIPTNRSEIHSARKRCSLFRQYLVLLEAHPFCTAFLTLFIAYIPYIYVCRPGIFTWDTYGIIVQAFPELKQTGINWFPAEALLSDSVFINQNQPPAYTLLLHGFLLLGNRLFRSYNAGVFLYSLFQMLCIMTVISCTVSILIRRNVISPLFAFFLVLYGIFHPVLHNIMFLVNKDSLYSASFFSLTIFLYTLTFPKGSKRSLYALFLFSAAMILLRNEGRYLLLVSYLLCACKNANYRKIFVFLFGFTLLFSVLVIRIIFPALSFTPGSVREKLSIPFQQTARYVRDYGDEVTEEEREAIDAVLDYDSLANLYLPIRSDPVKETYREGASKESMQRYFRAWRAMFRKHPGCYLQAFLHLYFEYFYPVDTRLFKFQFGVSVLSMKRTSQIMNASTEVFFHPDATYNLRANEYIWSDWISDLPVISALMTPGLYGWVLLLLVFYACRCKAVSAVNILAIPTALWLGCFLGPTNGYYGRYLLPIIMSIPALVAMTLHLCHTEREQKYHVVP